MKLISILPLLMAAICFYVGVYYLWFYLRRRKDPANLFFSITCISIALYDIFCTGLYSATTVSAGIQFQRYQFASLNVFTVSILWYSYHFFNFKNKKFLYLVTIWFTILIFSGLIIKNDLTLSLVNSAVKEINILEYSIVYNEAEPGILYQFQYASMIMVSLYIIILVIKRINYSEKKYVFPFIISLGTFFIASINDVLVGLGIISFIYCLEYAYMFIILSMAYVMQSRFIALYNEVEELNEQLQIKITDRTTELLFSEISNELYSNIVKKSIEDHPLKGEISIEPGKHNSITSIGNDLSMIANIEVFLEEALKKVIALTKSVSGLLFLNNNENELILNASVNKSDIRLNILPSTIPDALIGDSDNMFLYGDKDDKSIFLPIKDNGNCIGLCYLERDNNGNPFIKSDLSVADMFINKVSGVIENAFLYQRMINIEKATRKTYLTAEIELKMEKAVHFIENNYNYDISREGLASSLNLHPDSLGRYFKIHTGIKINDYINSLRIKEAAKMLTESSDTIANIAFSVGFESLPTFNRAFQKELKITPTEFRENQK